jgi:hypothetical protein
VWRLPAAAAARKRAPMSPWRFVHLAQVQTRVVANASGRVARGLTDIKRGKDLPTLWAWKSEGENQGHWAGLGIGDGAFTILEFARSRSDSEAGRFH